jgi:hypothetical protein
MDEEPSMELAVRGAVLALLAALVLAAILAVGILDQRFAATVDDPTYVTGESFTAVFAQAQEGWRLAIGLDGVFIILYALTFMVGAALWGGGARRPFAVVALVALLVLVIADIAENVHMMALLRGLVPADNPPPASKEVIELYVILGQAKWLAAYLTVAAFSFLPPMKSIGAFAAVWGGRLVFVPAGLTALVATGPIKVLALSLSLLSMVALFLALAAAFWAETRSPSAPTKLGF